MTERDKNYFQRRAQEEQAAAARAQHPYAREAHLELARCYADIADGNLSATGKLRVLNP